ncbi:hypothetical protein F7234_01705 [Pseudomonas putida]|uniref:trypsin-like peptidase domain-containing protein n=1 Tax=Pseudomonas putida TaxID=303 RepID=UPI00125EC827|nr:trypsin-like peptidase domain-containing protein [Pseudomonas putida]KAB5627115.1 hypothetical protein F7234_01705 [Pseudomonas putida]
MNISAESVGPASIIDRQSCSRFHCFCVELDNAQAVRLKFGNIRLPAGHYVELIDEKSRWINRTTLETGTEREVIVPGAVVFVRVVLPQAEDSFFSSVDVLQAEAYGVDPELLALIGKDERQPFICYEGSDIACYSLACAMMNLGNTGSGSLIGSGNFVLTNWHVVRNEEALRQARGEVWLNWINEACDKQSPVRTPLMLEAGHLIATGGGSGSSDYILFSLKEFDYTHSQVKQLFGGLRIRETNPPLNEPVFVPQYGNGGLMPMHVSVLHEDADGVERAAKVVGPLEENWTKCNADTQSGSSGSPIVSAITGELVGLHGTALGGKNGGPSPTRLHRGLGEIIDGYNEAVIGLGNVTVHNLELSSVMHAQFTIDLGQQGTIVPFDTVRFEHQDDRTLAHVRGLDQITQAQFDTTIMLQALTEKGPTNLADASLSGQVRIVASFGVRPTEPALSRCWLALGVHRGGDHVSSTVIRLTCHRFNPFEIPFSLDSARILHVHLDVGKPITLKVEGGRFGFVAHYPGTGPLKLQSAISGFSLLRVPVRGTDGEMKIVTLRGYRQREGERIAMNVAGGGLGSDAVSTLLIEYLPSDNADVDLPKGFEGTLPLLAMTSGQGNRVDVLVRVYRDGLVDPNIVVPPSGTHTGAHPRVSGRAAPGASVEVVKSHNPGFVLGTATADDGGAWALRIDRQLPTGRYSIAACHKTSLGRSQWSANRAFNVLEQLPAPTIDSPKDGAQSEGMVFRGSALPGSVVSLLRLEDDATLMEAHTDAEGRWYAYLSTKPEVGGLTLQVFQTLDGLISLKSSPLEIEVVAGVESPLILEPAADAQVSNRPVFRGRALANTAVTVAMKGQPGNVLGRAVADEHGDWSAPALKTLPPGPYAVAAKASVGSWSANRGFGVLEAIPEEAASPEPSVE